MTEKNVTGNPVTLPGIQSALVLILVLALLILVLLILLVLILIAVLLVLHSVCSSLLRLWPRG